MVEITILAHHEAVFRKRGWVHPIISRSRPFSATGFAFVTAMNFISWLDALTVSFPR
jgi:hypothetical protein